MITVTERAAKKVLAIATKDGCEPVMRVGVKGGGCSGFTYFFDFDAVRNNDAQVQVGGVIVVVDPKSLALLDGTVFDYDTDLLRGGFKFKNPNAAKTCSCGDSFGV